MPTPPGRRPPNSQHQFQNPQIQNTEPFDSMKAIRMLIMSHPVFSFFFICLSFYGCCMLPMFQGIIDDEEEEKQQEIQSAQQPYKEFQKKKKNNKSKNNQNVEKQSDSNSQEEAKIESKKVQDEKNKKNSKGIKQQKVNNEEQQEKILSAAQKKKQKKNKKKDEKKSDSEEEKQIEKLDNKVIQKNQHDKNTVLIKSSNEQLLQNSAPQKIKINNNDQKQSQNQNQAISDQKQQNQSQKNFNKPAAPALIQKQPHSHQIKTQETSKKIEIKSDEIQKQIEFLQMLKEEQERKEREEQEKLFYMKHEENMKIKYGPKQSVINVQENKNEDESEESDDHEPLMNKKEFASRFLKTGKNEKQKAKTKSKNIDLLSQLNEMRKQQQNECLSHVNTNEIFQNKEGMIVKSVMKPKKIIRTDDGKGEWEVIDKREKGLIQKIQDSD